MAVAAPPPRRGPAAVHQAHTSGTPLDDRPYEPEVAQPSGRVGLLVFALFAAVFFALGYKATIDQHVVVFDALNRLTDAYLVWWNDPPKLAAVGFLFPPLTTFVFLPLAAIKPIATSLIALPLLTALFGGGAMVWLDRTLARCEMPALLRYPLLVAFAANPMWLFYSGNGMSEVVYLAMLAFALYCFVSWYETTEPRFLIGAGFGIALLIVTRYAFIIWALLVALLIGVALVRRRASRVEVEGSVVAFAAPVVYAIALWILFNALIVGEPFGWLTDQTSTQAVNATGIDTSGTLGFDEVSRRLLELNLAVFPLAFVAVPALVIAFLGQRNDMALWLASFIVLGIVIMGVHAFIAQNEGLLTLRDSLPMALTSLVGAAWVYRSYAGFRLAIWTITGAMLLVNLVTAWQGMKEYPFQSLEQAYTRALFSTESQEGTSSRGGFNVGIDPEAQMAQYIKENVAGKDAILTDNAQTFGVVLLTGRPGVFLDRIDKGDAAWNTVLQEPWGEVQWMLVAYNPRSGDLIQARYPGLNAGRTPGITPVFRTERYVLARVADRDPGAAPPASDAEPAPAGGTTAEPQTFRPPGG
ncbi:MAG TPA: glycosyltransferase family 87 protein [Capillimicrobium sp.]|nr:glycosyltransferase family 87 protein [Capillimicrobium sp.]